MHLPAAAGETVRVGVSPASDKLARMPCLDAVGGIGRHRKSRQSGGG
jgi:hypothetical protein